MAPEVAVTSIPVWPVNRAWYPSISIVNMLKSSVYRSGKLWGALYEFDATGDTVPAHAHDKENDHHNVVCLKGRVRIPEFEIILEAGDIAEIDCTKEHSVVALEPSKTLHVCINGRPSFADYL